MKNCFKHTVMIEIMCAGALVFMLSILSYSLYLKNPIVRFRSAEKIFADQERCLSQKQMALSNEKSMMESLRQWQQNNPIFYDAIQSTFTLNQLLEQLTKIANNHGFSILEIKPFTDKKDVREKNKSSAHHVDFKISGQFQQLFIFIAAINASPYPISLNALTVSRKGEFDLQFALRGARD